MLGNNHKMTPEYRHIHDNPVRPSITICPWAMDKVEDTNMDLTLWIEKRNSDPSCQDAGDLRFPLSLLPSSFIFSPPRATDSKQTVSCVPPLRLGGTMPEIKGHTATGCSARLIDDVIRQWMTPGDHASPEGNLCRSQRLACCWCAIHTAPRQSCQRVITGSASPEQRTTEQAAAGWLWRSRSDINQPPESEAAWNYEPKKL